MLFSLPVFAEPQFYDISDEQTYAKQLKEKFYKKYPNGNYSGEDYYKEVTAPFYDYLYKKQKTDKTGVDTLYR